MSTQKKNSFSCSRRCLRWAKTRRHSRQVGSSASAEDARAALRVEGEAFEALWVEAFFTQGG